MFQHEGRKNNELIADLSRLKISDDPPDKQAAATADPIETEGDAENLGDLDGDGPSDSLRL